MIVIDITEQRHKTNLPTIPNSVSSSILEAVTGADIMVSTLKFTPKTEMLLHKHIKSGAILIQRKSGRDLANSVGVRLNSSIARMFECETYFAGQRVLLTTGIFHQNSAGKCIVGDIASNSDRPHVHWIETHMDYDAVMATFYTWFVRGGVSVISLANNYAIPAWLYGLEKFLIKTKDQPTKFILEMPDFPDDLPFADDPLQLPRRVTDFRRTLITFPGIGVTKARALWEYAQHDPATCILSLTDETDCPGIGKGIIANNREYWDLEPGMEIVKRYKDDYTGE